MSDFDPVQFVLLAIAIFVFLIRVLSFLSKGPFPAGSREDNDVRRGRTRQGTCTAGTASRMGGIGLSKLNLPDCVKKDVRFARLRRATLAGDWKTISMTLQALRGHDMRRFYAAIVAKAIEEEWQGWVPGSNECSFNRVLLDWEKSEGDNVDCHVLLIERLIAMAQHIKMRCADPALGYILADTALANAKHEIPKLSEAQKDDPLLRLALIHLLLMNKAVGQDVVVLRREVLVPPSSFLSSSSPSGEYTPVAHATEFELPPSQRDCAGTDASNDAGGSVRLVSDHDEENDPPIVHATIV